MYKNYTVGVPRFLIYLSLILLYAGPIQADTAAPADAADGPAAKTLSADELDNLVAPIALYPDALIAQVLPAATLPLEIVEAARYIKEQGGKVTEVPDKGWDQSIIALLEVPPVLEMMNDKLSWTVELGDAVFAQQGDVMDAVQRVRKAAKAAGKLESNEKQVVVVEKEVVTIVQAEPEIIYVPTTYYVPSTTTTVVAYSYPDPFVSFTLGLFVGAAISNGHWGYSHMGWGGHNVHRSYNSNRNVNRNVNRNINRGGGGAWKPSKRARTQYNARRDTAKRQARGLPAGRGTNRPANRAGTGNVNRPANRPASRPAAQRPSNKAGSRPSTGNKPASRPSRQAGSRPDAGKRPASRPTTQARPSRQPASRPTSRPSTRSSSQYGNRSSSFGGARSSGSRARTNSSRGFSSRGGGGFRGGGGRGGGRGRR